jgi:HEAT repeat protein
MAIKAIDLNKLDEEVNRHIAEGNWEKCVKIGGLAVPALLAALDGNTIYGSLYWERNKAIVDTARRINDWKRCIDSDNLLVRPLLAVLSYFTEHDESRDDQASVAIIETLGKIGDAQALDGLIKAAARADPVGPAAVNALADIGDPRAVIPILELLKQKCEAIRRYTDAPAGREYFIETMRKAGTTIQTTSHLEPHDFTTEVKALSRFGKEAVQPLLDAWQSCKYHVGGPVSQRNMEIFRNYVHSALMQIKDPAAVEPFSAALKSESLEIACLAAEMLGKIDGDLAIKALEQAMKENTEVREEVWQIAASSLNKTGWQPPDVETGIKCWLACNDHQKIIDLGKQAVEPLIQTLESEKISHYYRLNAAALLGEIGDLRAVEPLIHVLQKEPAIPVIEALGVLGDERATDPLIECLQVNNEKVRKAAFIALGKIDCRPRTLMEKTLGKRKWVK